MKKFKIILISVAVFLLAIGIVCAADPKIAPSPTPTPKAKLSP